jgi:hypothetical protein
MAKQAENAPKTYVVLGNLKHAGKIYRKGSKVQLTDAEAGPQLRYKTVEPAK